MLYINIDRSLWPQKVCGMSVYGVRIVEIGRDGEFEEQAGITSGIVQG